MCYNNFLRRQFIKIFASSLDDKLNKTNLLLGENTHRRQRQKIHDDKKENPGKFARQITGSGRLWGIGMTCRNIISSRNIFVQVIGRLDLGVERCEGSALHHWQEIQTSPRRQIAEWHKLKPE